MSTHEPLARRAAPGSYRELFAVVFPLILSSSSMTLMMTADRVFLAWYSPQTLAAALPAGAAAWLFLGLFVGVAGYVATFVSQYHGAGQNNRVGAVLWQGVYFSLIAGLLLVLASFLAGPMFRLVGHPPDVQREESMYFWLLMLFGGGEVLGVALSSFYSGLHRTWTVLWVHLWGVALNIVLTYVMIFGVGPFPVMGIAGAGLSTALASWVKAAIFVFLLLRAAERTTFHTTRAWRFDRALFMRLLRFGVPNGVSITVEVTAFTIFVLLVGRIGLAELGATNIAFSINMMLFMPMLGMHNGVIVLVGRYQGAMQSDLAARITHRAAWITMAYMGFMALVLGLWPDHFVALYRPQDAGEDFAHIAAIARNLIYFVVLYSLVDAANLIYSAGLKGAGDTTFVMFVQTGIAFGLWLLPTFVLYSMLDNAIYPIWGVTTVYIFALAGTFWARFRAGVWREMRVIEHPPTTAGWAEGPFVESPMIDGSFTDPPQADHPHTPERDA